MSKPSKTSSALAIVTDPQISISVEISKLQSVALHQIQLINALHRDAALHAIFAGLMLHRIKASLKHGEWMPWQKKHFKGAGKSQVNYYMRLSVVAVEKIRATKAELQALPADGSLAIEKSDGAARKFFDRLGNFVGSKSLNELLDEHGIKETKKIGGARESDEADEPTATPDAEQLYFQFRDEIGGTLQRAESLLLKENGLQYLVGHEEEIRGVVTGLRELADKVEAAAKPLLKK